MHEVLVNHLGGLSLPRKSVVRLTDRPAMTLDVYRGRKTMQQCNHNKIKAPFISMFWVIKLHATYGFGNKLQLEETYIGNSV